ncbi:hypothetical protein SEABISCUIT_38 [Mycobacterium phage Seabiscuit]|uniref:hypothetical protein n=1 Tax=Mycobacterium phage Seabiscuit TaxID=1458714 RepID=UPI00043ACFCF|nr:hypothetical protein SEABISCUIT_38 [Mycobacterium phage Seabiscuit]AHN84356.1 hypothetical protein SEABISCUIT_38 [Mycobacterium phage Seabiscuit]
MLRTTAAAGILAAGLGLGIAPIAQAAPAHCSNHGFGHGQIYKHACATGSGGASADWNPVFNDDGSYKTVHKNGKDHKVYKCVRHCGGGRGKTETTDPW